MDRFDTLRIFQRVAETRSFTKAAASVQIPRSTVSVAVQELEASVGARLLNRTTRHVALTHDGAAFYERCTRLLADLEDAVTLFRQGTAKPVGKLRVDAPGRIARRIIAPALPDFFARYPEIELDLGATDHAVDLVEEGVDCAIRVGTLNDSSLIARPLGRLELINCASPVYLAKYGVPEKIADLTDHLAVNYASPFTGRLDEWECVENGESRKLPMRGLVTVNNAESYIACCLAGLGLIQIPAYDVRHHLEAGRLSEVLRNWRAAPMPITLLYPHRRHLSRRLKVFVDWIEKLLASETLTSAPGMGSIPDDEGHKQESPSPHEAENSVRG
ncbi:LysR family transcriptional regulator [Mesorhizobium muleiense]|uniref:LysR family transcriptional regulator n=1 Tax=Mesorhizobium muleiense TaxID=1004279 RepID=UPI001F42FB82|nr:LysR family transcriptional regulator [Mesorhizobium muleiense]MCF6114261.1 LysR family transcriptional regulator [Mesorhizobium muleiense]